MQHPAAKSMIEISRTQDEEVGDGTTSVIILGKLCLDINNCRACVCVVVNFLSQVIFVFLLFLGMVIYANEVETKEK